MANKGVVTPPEPPTLEEIHADIFGANDNDVCFLTTPDGDGDADISLPSASHCYVAPSFRQLVKYGCFGLRETFNLGTKDVIAGSNNSMQDHRLQPAADYYEKACQFVDMNIYLQQVSHKLENSIGHLKASVEELTAAAASLKHKSESMKNP